MDDLSGLEPLAKNEGLFICMRTVVLNLYPLENTLKSIIFAALMAG